MKKEQLVHFLSFTDYLDRLWYIKLAWAPVYVIKRGNKVNFNLFKEFRGWFVQKHMIHMIIQLLKMQGGALYNRQTA